MKESEYIIAANLAKLKIADEVIRDCIILDPGLIELQTKILRSISGLQSEFHGLINIKVDT